MTRELAILPVLAASLTMEAGAGAGRGQCPAAVKRLDIEYPVMLDNDFSYWNAFNNRHWPAFYLIDRQGRVQARAFGELHAGTARGDDVEKTIQRLLAEKPAN
jgi:hypothetical protein